MKQITTTIILALIASLAFAATPVVSNILATPSAGKVSISYDLAADAACQIILVFSSDDGASFDIIQNPAALSGDIGDQITPGTGKQIIWHPAMDNMEIGDNYRVKVIARDNPVQSDNQFTSFIKVEGGTFHNGTSDVTVSSFFMDKYQLTQGEYEAVMGNNPSYFGGNPSHPVEQVTWYNAIEYSNRRSLQEGLTPCYSYGTYGTDPSDWPSGWNDQDQNHINVSCSWVANGYRLPTEMEWMFAARGGNQTHNYTYSGSNTIGDVAWYYVNSGNTTHPVGGKLPNELGLYDISGNVWEWCWDIYGKYPDGPQTNPHGATSGNYRMLRGGRWDTDQVNCRVSFRNYIFATHSNYGVGFRCLRVSP